MGRMLVATHHLAKVMLRCQFADCLLQKRCTSKTLASTEAAQDNFVNMLHESTCLSTNSSVNRPLRAYQFGEVALCSVSGNGVMPTWPSLVNQNSITFSQEAYVSWQLIHMKSEETKEARLSQDWSVA